MRLAVWLITSVPSPTGHPAPCLQGAVLEPQGVVEIKFRAPELIATMHRIDPLILKLKVGAGLLVLWQETVTGALLWKVSSQPRTAPRLTEPAAPAWSASRFAAAGRGRRRRRCGHQGARAPAAACVPPSGHPVCTGGQPAVVAVLKWMGQCLSGPMRSC